SQSCCTTDLGNGGTTTDGAGEPRRQAVAGTERRGVRLRGLSLSSQIQVREAVADDAREARREHMVETALEPVGIRVKPATCAFEAQHAVGRAESQSGPGGHLPRHAG